MRCRNLASSRADGCCYRILTSLYDQFPCHPLRGWSGSDDHRFRKISSLTGTSKGPSSGPDSFHFMPCAYCYSSLADSISKYHKHRGEQYCYSDGTELVARDILSSRFC